MRPSPVGRRRPGRLERILSRLAGEQIAEAAWGDLEEEAAVVLQRHGWLVSRIWIWLEGVRLILGWIPRDPRIAARRVREVAMDGWTVGRRRLVAILGALVALPAAVLVVSGLMYTLSGSRAVEQTLDSTLFDPQGFVYRVLLHPVTVLGGLALALALNLLPLLRIHIDRQPGNLTGTLAVRLRAAHLAVSGVGLTLLALILAYAFTENFAVVPRPPAASEAAAATERLTIVPPLSQAGPAAVAVGAGWTAVRRAGEEWVVNRIPTEEMLSIPLLCPGLVSPPRLEVRSPSGSLLTFVLDCPLQSTPD
jgi:hypothetical protein